ncbi:hypothetical protein SLEP1_g7658 [Rubroshorea leprosula]|uniref:Uncharacterized protein n=1 Tax=Rubroshorea leprosula TaxID=152421 RepID=A0AAV5I561_9ROSI|nr:hypothetical protein SLEP1_g7658 [Rubroshorea leprosula]
MALQGYHLFLLILLGSLTQIKSTTQSNLTASLNRHSFPPDFVFGAASSAYQYEVELEKVVKDEVPGIFSLTNIQFVVHCLAGIKPVVTHFHWDLPQALEDEYGGFLGPNIVDDFRDYAGICFREFGDRVKQWITLNDPWSYSTGGYATGTLAPGRRSSWQKLNCSGGTFRKRTIFGRAPPPPCSCSCSERDGIPIGSLVCTSQSVILFETAGSDWFYVYPRGPRHLLLYTKRKYNNPLVYITENGVYQVNNDTLSPKKVLADNYRIDYHLQHLASLKSAIKAGTNVQGYFARSLLDAFEWSYGYTASLASTL